MNDKNIFLNESCKTLDRIYDIIYKSGRICLDNFKINNSALILVDMINGFAKEGSLSSPRVKKIIPNIYSIIKNVSDKGIKLMAFRDCHCNDAVEFNNYPVHCLKESTEKEIVDELKCFKYNKIIDKNSINGFLEEDFQIWLSKNKNIDTFIIIGDCTDICIMNLALSLKCYFNVINKSSSIIVPIDGVETFDFDIHNGDLMNLISLYIMKNNGIEIGYIN